MDFKIYKVWTEEFKGYYWEIEENCVYDYYFDDDCDDVECILDARTLRNLEQHNKNTKKFAHYPARIVAERFKLVELSNEDLTALTLDILDDDMLNTNYENIYYVKGELYYFDENTEKLYHCESEGMISPVGYDPNDEDEDDDDC